jgi:Zn-dependent protease with chaperone function
MRRIREVQRPLSERERRHRRAILLGLSVLLILSTSPLLAHHLFPGLEAHLGGRDHLWALCLVALHLVMEPVHGGFHILFLAGFLYALADRIRAWSRQRRVLGALMTSSPAPGDPFARASAAAGTETSRVRVVEGLPTPAFTAGLLSPRIYVARSLAERLSGDELEAVLAHEAAHLKRRDPLRLSVLRFLSCMLFWLPAVRRLTEDMADEAEIRADDHASRDRPLALASAILTLAQWTRPVPTAPAAVGFDDRQDLLERRVRRLAGQDVPPRSRVTRRSVATAAFALSLAWGSGAAIAHPLPSQTAAEAEHCEEHGRAAVLQLFCIGFAQPAAPGDCPHRDRA